MSLTAQQILALTCIKGIGNQAILEVGNSRKSLIETDELPSILEKCAVKKTALQKKIPVSPEDIWEAMEKAENIIARSKEQGVGRISYYEKNFPKSLRDTKTEDGKKPDSPLLLFYRGNLDALKLPCLAVIGTRKCLPEAGKAGRYLAQEFAKRGFCIVSGLALGCDTSGHRGALDVGGHTIAFLAHGLDSIYPAQNKGLAKEIVENGGLLLSEYPIGTKPLPSHFVARDRLQAGLSLATLVIQTGVSGGTLHAARNTSNSGKPLYVVQYTDPRIDRDKESAGNHMLVRENGAKYLTATENLDAVTTSILEGARPKKQLSSGSLLDAIPRSQQLSSPTASEGESVQPKSEILVAEAALSDERPTRASVEESVLSLGQILD